MFEDEEEQQYDTYGNPVSSSQQAQDQYEDSLADVRGLTSLLQAQADRQAQIQKIYDEAAQRLSESRVGPSRRARGFAVAADLLAPTQTGSTWEAIGRAAKTYGAYEQQMQDAQRQRDEQLAELRMKRQIADLEDQAKRHELIARYGLGRRTQNRPVIIPAGSIAIDPLTRKVIARGNPRRTPVQVTNPDGTKTIEFIEDPGTQIPEAMEMTAPAVIPTASSPTELMGLLQKNPDLQWFRDPSGNVRQIPPQYRNQRPAR